MYAIIKTGGKQYRVEKDDIIDVELLNADVGAQVDFEDILFINNGKDTHIGEPLVSGYVVRGEVVGNTAGPKIVSLKYMRRQHWKKKWGHRQHYAQVKILEIGSQKESKPRAAAAKKEEQPAVKEAKPKKAPQAKEKAAAEPKAKAAAPKKAKEDKETKPKATSKKTKKES